MKILVQAYDTGEMEDYGLFDLTEGLAQTIAAGHRTLMEMKTRPHLVNTREVVIGATNLVKYFREDYLGEEGVHDDKAYAVEALGFEKDLLTDKQREELRDREVGFTVVANDFKPYPPDGEEEPWTYTDFDELVIQESGFFFKSQSDNYVLETQVLNYSILSRVL